MLRCLGVDVPYPVRPIMRGLARTLALAVVCLSLKLCIAAAATLLWLLYMGIASAATAGSRSGHSAAVANVFYTL